MTITVSGYASARYIAFRDGSGAAPSGIGEGNIAFDPTIGLLKESCNGGPYLPLGSYGSGWFRDPITATMTLVNMGDNVYKGLPGFGPPPAPQFAQYGVLQSNMALSFVMADVGDVGDTATFMVMGQRSAPFSGPNKMGMIGTSVAHDPADFPGSWMAGFVAVEPDNSMGIGGATTTALAVIGSHSMLSYWDRLIWGLENNGWCTLEQSGPSVDGLYWRFDATDAIGPGDFDGGGFHVYVGNGVGAGDQGQFSVDTNAGASGIFVSLNHNSSPVFDIDTDGTVRAATRLAVGTTHSTTGAVNLEYDGWITAGVSELGLMTMTGSAVMHLGHTNPLYMPAFIRANVNDSFVVESQAQVCLDVDWTAAIIGGNGAWVGLRAAAAVDGEMVTVSGEALFDDVVRTKRRVIGKNTTYAVQAYDSGTLFTNAGAAASVTFHLPSATVGLHYRWVVLEAQQIVIDAIGSDQIVFGINVSSPGGTCHANVKGYTLHMTCVATGVWWITSHIGNWTLT